MADRDSSDRLIAHRGHVTEGVATVDEPEPGGLFQGNELSRLMILLVIAVGGWAAVWFYMTKAPGIPDEPDPVVNGKPPAVTPDPSIEFETVADKKPILLRDMAAYSKLVTRAQATPASALSAEARRDVFYAHLLDSPKDYRGVPVHLLGTARRILYYKSKLSRTGWLYEAWMYTADSQNNPWVCVFEDAPKGLPIGPNVSERVVFNGYFLKLMSYQAGDVPRAVPLLIGRVGWTRPASTVTSDRSVYWLGGAIALMFTMTLFRWILQLRRSFAPAVPRSFLRDRPTEEIAPEELSAFLGNLHDDEDHVHDPSR